MVPKLRERVVNKTMRAALSSTAQSKPRPIRRRNTRAASPTATNTGLAKKRRKDDDSPDIILPEKCLTRIAQSIHGQQYWLMKAEPESRIVKGKDVRFSIDDLAAMPGATSPWDGVRNYEARNIMRDRMRIGDQVLFYHSNCKEPGVAGIAEIVRQGYPDYTATDPEHPYYDPKCKPDDPPKWFMVDVRFVRKFPRIISLKELKTYQHDVLSNLVLLKRGRLSVQPVTREEFDFIVALADQPSP